MRRGWRYLPPLDVSQSKGSTEIITVVVKGATFTPIPLATSSVGGRMSAQYSIPPGRCHAGSDHRSADGARQSAASSAASRGPVCRQGACNPQSSSPQNRSTQGRSSISHVQALRGWSRMAI
jgi:hypothetical protein